MEAEVAATLGKVAETMKAVQAIDKGSNRLQAKETASSPEVVNVTVAAGYDSNGLFDRLPTVPSYAECYEIELHIARLQNAPPQGKAAITEAERIKLLAMVARGHRSVFLAWRIAKETVRLDPSKNLLLEFWIGIARFLESYGGDSLLNRI